MDLLRSLRSGRRRRLLWASDDAQLRVEIEVFVLSIAICQTNDMAIAILVSVSMLN